MISVSGRVLLEEWDVSNCNEPFYLPFGTEYFSYVLKDDWNFIQSTILSIYFVMIKYTTTLFQTIIIFQIKIIQEKVNKHLFPKS